MFCSNCGKQIPDNTKFCNYCGAQQQIAENTESAPKATENQQKNAGIQAKKAPNNNANIIVILAIVLCAFLLGKFVIAPLMVSDSGKGDDTSNQSQQATENNGEPSVNSANPSDDTGNQGSQSQQATENNGEPSVNSANPSDDTGDQGSQSQQTTENNGKPSVDSANPAYDEIFDNTYIVHFQTFFNMEMKSFALKQNDGIIFCADYGYKDDVVKKLVETTYIPVSGYTDTQKAELENTMKTQFSIVDALNCCAVTYKMSNNYLTVTCTYSDMDKAENYGELYNAQILQKNTFISMSATESTLLSQGFVKK